MTELRDRPNERLASWLLVVVKNHGAGYAAAGQMGNACEELPEGQAVPADGGEFRALVEIIRRMRRITAGCWSCGSWRNGA